MEKRVLGRGLGALLSTPHPGETSSLVREVPLEQIRANPFQPRHMFDDEKLSDLESSIIEHGVLQPIIVKQTGPSTYELVAGERRVRAARRAGLASVPAIVRDYAPPQMLEIALIENLQREDINPVDAAQAYLRLRTEFSLTQEEIARRVGKAQSTIANTLRLLSLPEPILDSLRHGEITEGHARALLGVAPNARIQACEEIKRRGLSVREVEKLARELRDGLQSGSQERSEREPAARDPHMAAIEEALETALGTRVRIRATHAGGRIEIEYYSELQLEGLVERLIGE